MGPIHLWNRLFGVHHYLLIILIFLLVIHSIPAINDFHNIAQQSFQPNTVHKLVTFGESSMLNSTEDIPVIVWWTESIYPHTKDYKRISCADQRSACYSTRSRSFASDDKKRGFIFYGTDFDPRDVPLPRELHHEWALLHEESPFNNMMLTHAPLLQMFNYTSTFQRTSDYPLTSQFIPSLSYLMERKPLSVNKKNQLMESDGLSPILFIQSHCQMPSDRERYVKELMKYVKIDSYGKCLHNKDILEKFVDPVQNLENTEFFDFIARYKFHLAFENFLCDDYMTEKLFRPLHVGSVPIYFGSSKAQDWMPSEKAAIFVKDFSSVKELAEFIQYLNIDDPAYEQYLTFKTPGGITNKFLIDNLNQRPWAHNDPVVPNFIQGFECFVCHEMNERIRHKNSGQPISHRIAKSSHLRCPQPHPSVGTDLDIPAKDWWHAQDWPEQYWFGLDQAKAFKRMLENEEKDSSNYEKYYKEVIATQ